MKAKEIGAPGWDGEFYAVAVYDVPGLKGSGTDEITRDDKRIRFTAQIARPYLERNFDTGEMEFQGRMQL
jgi:hypothetical protein